MSMCSLIATFCQTLITSRLRVQETTHHAVSLFQVCGLVLMEDKVIEWIFCLGIWVHSLYN